MDLSEAGDAGSGCRDENCSSALSSPVSHSDHLCKQHEPIFGFIYLVLTSVVYILLMIFGLLGNMLTILVVWLRPYMRSSTYLYLSSMAVSDMLILLLLPLELYKLWWPSPWPLGVLPCKLTMFLSECCTFCTILHITFLSLERYLAVCWPMTAKTLVTRRRTKTIIGCLWLGAAVSAAPVWVMVGVEDVGMEYSGHGGWQEGEGEEGFLIEGSGQDAFQDGRAGEGNSLTEKDVKEWADTMKEFNNIVGKGEEKPVKEKWSGGDEAVAGRGRTVEVEGERQNKLREDEGGGENGGSFDYGDFEHRGDCDTGECRWTNYAITSGLLSAMLILSNMYFLVPVCILGLVYSLIGRTLWYRPQSSRRDRSHRHTVKMLGVIVLAFVLCWLPFHVGRTIFTLYHLTYEQAVFPDTDSHFDNNASSDGGGNSLTSIPAMGFTCFKGPADTEKTLHTRAGGGDFLANGDRDVQNNTHADMETNNARASTRVRTTSIVSIRVASSPHRALPNESIVLNDVMSSDHLHHMLNETHPDNPYTDFFYFLVQYFNLVSSVFFYLSTAVNPLLYNLMSVRYKHAVHSLIHAHSHVQSNRRHTFTAAGQSTTAV